MKRFNVTLPRIAFLVATRALLGVGAGLLAAPRLRRARRRRIALTLVAVGVLTTLPAAYMILGRRADDLGDRAATA